MQIAYYAATQTNLGGVNIGHAKSTGNHRANASSLNPFIRFDFPSRTAVSSNSALAISDLHMVIILLLLLMLDLIQQEMLVI